MPGQPTVSATARLENPRAGTEKWGHAEACYDRSVRAVLALGLCGCSSIFGLKSPTPAVDAATIDDVGDGAPDAPPDASSCLGSGELEVCFDAMPTGPTAVTGALDTGSPSAPCATTVHWTSAAQPVACFIVGTDLTVGPATIHGPKPIVLVATGSISFSGLVDLSSHNASQTIGPGGNPTGCIASSLPAINNNGGGGGAGATGGTRGGGGGTGSNSAAGGVSDAVSAIDDLRGGCQGQAGARGGGGQAGVPGFGGGALYAVAGDAIALGSATIAANGAGALQSQNRWGGSGGGAGGMIVLHAATITATASAILVANGGGGASGTDSGGGTPGSDPDPMMPLVPAPGGAGQDDGGAGFAIGHAGQPGGDAAGGILSGAGGGGGGGSIRANVTIGNITASPAVVITP